ncbi:MAG: cob(I)yrinic acid a,c-diamide adenosyltransferase [Candidatus Cloacimonadota bacterium]|nr:cob(I)yrinic acid a,c-diamide adenosyltransferase [Candidatus Cloacimonadota bacterium]
MLQIYTGNGKGKTTAAIGLAIRYLGHNKKVCLIQFMKKNFKYGEIVFLSKIKNVDVFQFGTPEFVNKINPKPIDFEEAEKGLKKAKEVLKSKKYDLIILDELNVALDFNLLELSKVLSLLDEIKNEEVVITGRYAPPELVAKADLVTEMREVKHYYKKGIGAREGNEY